MKLGAMSTMDQFGIASELGFPMLLFFPGKPEPLPCRHGRTCERSSSASSSRPGGGAPS